MAQRPAINIVTGRVEFTTHLNKRITFCVPPLCCDAIGDILEAWIFAESSGSGGAQSLACDFIYLIKDPLPDENGCYNWRANVTSGVWTNCIQCPTCAQPFSWELKFQCCNTLEPTLLQCDFAFGGTMPETDPTDRVNVAAGCCCEPMCASGGADVGFPGAGGIGLEVVDIPQNACPGGQWNGVDQVSMQFWIYDADYDPRCTPPNHPSNNTQCVGAPAVDPTPCSAVDLPDLPGPTLPAMASLPEPPPGLDNLM